MAQPVNFEIEHIAYSVKDPVAVARWYVQHLGMRVAQAQVDAYADESIDLGP